MNLFYYKLGISMKKEIVEWCSHCGAEVEMQWDIEESGYKAYCPYCGEMLMLCDECIHSDSPSCDWNSKTQSCKRLILPNQKANWILTDPDSCQYVRKLSEFEFELIEMSLIAHEPDIYQVYTDVVSVYDYLTNSRTATNDILNSFGYNGLDEVVSRYGEEGSQVIAECIFEFYGSYYANILFEGTEDECIEFINEYVQKQ